MLVEDDRRGRFASLAMRLVAPLLRHEIVRDENFIRSLDLATESTVTFQPAGVTFKQMPLLSATREAIRGRALTVKDETGRDWTIAFNPVESPVKIILAAGQDVIHLPQAGLLSESATERLSAIEAEATRVNLPAAAKANWRVLASERALDAEEISRFAEDINNTPIAVANAISVHLNRESVPFDVLVPTSLSYYERLIGCCDDKGGIVEYTNHALPEFLEELFSWNLEAGMRHAVLLASHPLVIDRIAGIPCDKDTFSRVAEWAARSGDPMACCVLLELAVMRSEVSNDTKQSLDAAISTLIVSNDQKDEGFEMLSSGFIFVYGQLSYRHALNDKPTFWRRMAAMAQAALIARCIGPRRGALAEFTDYMRRSRARVYAIQVYIDMRLGPMWQGQFALLPQLRNELVGRVVFRAVGKETEAAALGILARIVGDKAGSLKSTIDLLSVHRAGPLEDDVPSVREMTEEDRTMVEVSLREANPTARSFATLVNSALFFRQTVEMADLAADTLARAQYRFSGDDEKLVPTALNGLATCAAMTRSVKLANAVLTVLRYYLHFSPGELDLDSSVRIGFIACAAWVEKSAWTVAVGDFLTELAYNVSTPEEAKSLADYIGDLCEMVPELWASCGPALAAAESLCFA